MSEARDSPVGVSTERLGHHRRAAEELRRWRTRLSLARLAVFTGGLILLWPVFISRVLGWAWLVPSMAVFLALLVLHERVIRRLELEERAVAYHERCLDRLGERWAGAGSRGDAFLDPEHPYAADLDLFGHGSLFELLCTARTRVGERTLATWLCAPASPATIRDRQAAVRELAGKLDLRESLAVVGPGAGSAVDPEELIAWSTAPGTLPPRWLTWVAAAAGVSNVTTLVLWFVVPWGPLSFLVSATLGGLLALAFQSRVRRVVDAAGRPVHELRLLSDLLSCVERERFDSPRLTELRAELDALDLPPSRRIGRLARLVELNDSRRNMMFSPFAALTLFGTQLALAMERWRARSGHAVGAWLETLGEIEALTSLGTFAHEHPDDPFPEIVDRGSCFEATGLGHPLLPEARCVRNDLQLDAAGMRLFLVSGSNMSGKSTWLRTVGINAVLAQAGATVRAERFRLTPLAVGACMRVQDSLQEGLSHFYAEVRRLRQIVDLGSAERPLLFLLDEILHGTNSHDRRLGAEALIRQLLGRGAIGLVTTHDLALARIADDLGGVAANAHFSDRLSGDRLEFDYRVSPGVAGRGNALALMRAAGLDV